MRPGSPRGERNRMARPLLRDGSMYLMILPGFLLVLVFHYIPLYGLVIAFKDYDITSSFFGGAWVGFKHFVSFFRDPYFIRIFRNTILLNVYGIIFAFPAPIIFALLLNEVTFSSYKRFVQSISYLPYFISTVVIVGIMFRLFSSAGVVNALGAALGLKRQLFFSTPGWFRPLYIGSGIWQGTGYSAIVYLAAIAGVNVELYESAVIDGANRWRQALHITMPSIMPTIKILFILTVGSIMSVGFDKVYLMYNPSIYESADVISTYVYRRGIEGMDFSFSTAVGLFNSVVGFAFLYASNYISRKTSEHSLW